MPERYPPYQTCHRRFQRWNEEGVLDEEGIEMIAPQRKNRRKPKTQDGRKLRRYKRRWKIERLFAWLAEVFVRWVLAQHATFANLLLKCQPGRREEFRP